MQNVTVDRDKYIGGSDIPIIMGISPFKTRFQLLQEKAGLIQDEFNGNQYTEYGNALEPKIRDFINEKEKDKFAEGKDIIDYVRCHTDGINKTTVLEIKTTSQIHNTLEEYKVYLVQLLFYMNNTKRKKGKLAVYERPADFNEEFDETRLSIYDLDVKDYKDLITEINIAVDKFRIDLQKIKDNPFITEEELTDNKVVKLANKVLSLEKELKGYDELKKQYDEFKEELRQAMLSNKIKKWETPNGTKFTLVLDTPDTEIEVETYDEEKFIKENVELHEEYHNKLAEYKVVKTQIKKGKKGSLRITLPKEEK